MVKAMARCETNRDPLRHVINKVLAEAASRVPAPVLEDLRKAFSKAEDKYKFSIYGGDPSNLVKYLSSDDFKDLLALSINLNVEWVVKDILEGIADEYRVSCPEISKTAMNLLEWLERKELPAKKGELNLENIYRKLRMMGYNPERISDNTIKFSLIDLTVMINVKEDIIEYEICKKGKAYTLDGLLTKLSKIMEI